MSSTGSGILNGCGTSIIYGFSGYSGDIDGVTCQAAAEEKTGDVYYYMNTTHVLIYGSGNMLSSYSSNSAPWVKYRDTLTSVRIEYGVTIIGKRAFYYWVSSSDRGYNQITLVKVGNSVATIREKAFAYCSSLTRLTIGNSVTTIELYAFAYCSSLTTVTIRNSVTSIGNWAFYCCTSLSSITIKSTSSLYIGESSFYECALTTIIFEGRTEPECHESSSNSYCNYQPFCICPSSGCNDINGYDMITPSVTVQVPSGYPPGEMFCNLPTEPIST